MGRFVNEIGYSEGMNPGFEFAADAIVSGDLTQLRSVLDADPSLIRARSARPHRATLLHYVAANGVEDERQKSPSNAAEIARFLLTSGAAVDATAEMYNAPQTTLNMLVSSAPPAQAGVQVPVAEVLLDFGAGKDTALMTALAHGYSDVAQILAKRGADAANLPAAAGLGRESDARRFLPEATSEQRHIALALAAQHGHIEVVRMLLDAGEDPNRLNPQGYHGHSTPLHQAALAAHEPVVHLLVQRGARTDITDSVYHGTPLGWALHAGHRNIARFLESVV